MVALHNATLKRLLVRTAAIVLIVAPLITAAATPHPTQSPSPPPPNHNTATPNQNPVTHSTFRALIVGDSLTHGKANQHTWRYRLWQHLSLSSSSLVSPLFVGPFNGTYLDDHNTSTYWKTNGPYADDCDPRFLNESRFHAAMWGRALAWSASTIQQWVEDYQPDWVLVMMGFNDMAWLGSGVDETVGNMELFIQRAREAKPDVNFLVANVPFQKKVELLNMVNITKEYNRKLEGNLTKWEAAGGEKGGLVRLVDVNRGYGCAETWCPDGWDGLHPNEEGEWDLARAFSVSLVGLGVVRRAIGLCLID